MDGAPGNKVRGIGMLVTTLVLIGLAGYAIVIPYFEQPRPAQTEMVDPPHQLGR